MGLTKNELISSLKMLGFKLVENHIVTYTDKTSGYQVYIDRNNNIAIIEKENNKRIPVMQRKEITYTELMEIITK